MRFWPESGILTSCVTEIFVCGDTCELSAPARMLCQVPVGAFIMPHRSEDWQHARPIPTSADRVDRSQ